MHKCIYSSCPSVLLIDFVIFCFCIILNYNEFMDIKLFKLNLKIAWMRATGRLAKVNKSLEFTSNKIISPSILVIFPIERDFVAKAMSSISGIINSQKENNAKFSFIINNNIENRMSYYEIETLSLVVLKNGKIDNSNDVLDKIYFKKFDIIIDLNVNFRLDIALMVKNLDSKYKIGFISKYSDLFYNIQLQLM